MEGFKGLAEEIEVKLDFFARLARERVPWD